MRALAAHFAPLKMYNVQPEVCIFWLIPAQADGLLNQRSIDYFQRRMMMYYTIVVSKNSGNVLIFLQDNL